MRGASSEFVAAKVFASFFKKKECYTKSMTRPGSVAVIAIFAVIILGGAAYWFLGYNPEPEPLLPGEAEFLLHLEAVESMAAVAPPNCVDLRNEYKATTEAFKVLLPELVGFQIRKRDDRVGKVNEFIEANC